MSKDTDQSKRSLIQDIISSDILSESIIRTLDDKACFLDKNNIVWKVVNNKWIGKRSVWTFDFRACWLEDTILENVKSWWCGIDSDYTEIFIREVSIIGDNGLVITFRQLARLR